MSPTEEPDGVAHGTTASTDGPSPGIASTSARSTARIPTPSGQRYMVQLCKHWAHKFPDTVVTDTEGRVPFDADRAVAFAADPDGLTMVLTVADPAALDRMERVVVDHLRRFAFREDLGEVSWTRTA